MSYRRVGFLVSLSLALTVSSAVHGEVQNYEPATLESILKPATTDAGDDEYTYGLRLWEAGFYPQAQWQLALFLERYPTHARVTFGRHLLGRAYLDAGEPRRAAPHFFQNYQTNKQAARAPDSLLYLAESMVQLRDTTRACIALNEFRQTYPADLTGRLQVEYLVISGRASYCAASIVAPPRNPDLVSQQAPSRPQVATTSSSAAPSRSGQLTVHSATCARYGFSQGTTEFASCVMQLDQTAQTAQAQERQYQLQLQQYQQQVAAYEAQRQALERQRRREEGAAFLRGLAQAPGCQNALDCFARGAAAELGAQLPPPPVQPQMPPAIQYYTLRTANGSTVNCTFLAGVNHMDCR